MPRSHSNECKHYCTYEQAIIVGAMYYGAIQAIGLGEQELAFDMSKMVHLICQAFGQDCEIVTAAILSEYHSQDIESDVSIYDEPAGHA